MQGNKLRKIIVAVAPVGKNIQPPSKNPITPEEVVSEVIVCDQAGASLVHLHVRDDVGMQTEDVSVYSQTLDLIRQSSGIIIQGSTGGLTSLTREERCVALNDARTESASLNMGSINFGEEVYVNTLADIRYWAKRMQATRVVPELEIFAAGMLATYQHMVSEDVLKPPFSIGFCLGVDWALPADPETLFFMKTLLAEKAVPWGVIHAGMQDLSLLATAIGMGASVVRVGFEDSVYYARGQVAASNMELVTRIVALIQDMGLAVASCAEARDMLGIST